jgi:hypothetical protein
MNTQTPFRRHATPACACRGALILLAILSLLSCKPSLGLVIERGGVTAEADGFWVQAGGLSLKDNVPGVLFGMASLPGGDRELRYVLLFKHRATADSKVTFPSNATLENRDKKSALMDDGLEIDGNAVNLRLALEFDSKKNAIASESLSFNGEKVDLTKGRVFLVDLTAAPVKWEQAQMKLPAKLPDPKALSGAREVVNRILAELPHAPEQVRNFMK